MLHILLSSKNITENTGTKTVDCSRVTMGDFCHQSLAVYHGLNAVKDVIIIFLNIHTTLKFHISIERVVMISNHSSSPVQAVKRSTM